MRPGGRTGLAGTQGWYGRGASREAGEGPGNQVWLPRWQAVESPRHLAAGSLPVPSERGTQEHAGHWGGHSQDRGQGRLRHAPLKISTLSSSRRASFYSNAGASLVSTITDALRLRNRVPGSTVVTVSLPLVTRWAAAGGLGVQAARAGLVTAQVSRTRDRIWA